MILRELLDSMNLEKRKMEREQAAQKFAIGVAVAAAAGVLVGILCAPQSGKETREELKNKCFKSCSAIKDTLHQKAEMVKDYAVNAEQEATNVIKGVAEKTEAVTNDIKVGSHEIAQDVHKTAEKVSDEINKSVK